MYNENLVPVTNRRCLCELAKEIGFLEQAQKIFSLEQQLSTFRHLVSKYLKFENLLNYVQNFSNRKWCEGIISMQDPLACQQN